MRYVAAVDPSGGGADAFALAIVHLDGGRFVQDVMRSWASSRTASVDLAQVCAEIAGIVKGFGLYAVTGDRYAGKWVSQEFQKVGIAYREAEIDKSHAYRELEPFLAQGRVELLDHPAMLRELRLLEKRHRAGGKTPLVDHPKGGHDDHANALALAVAELAKSMHPAAAMTDDQVAAEEAGGLGDDGRSGFFRKLGPVLTAAREAREAEGAEVGAPRGRGRFWR